MTTKELLALSDDELLIAAAPAYWGLMGESGKHKWREHYKSGGYCTCSKCDAGAYPPFTYVSRVCPQTKPIPCCCIEKAAREMRDACDFRKWKHCLEDVQGRVDFPNILLMSTAKQQVIAAMLSWEGCAK